MLKHNNINKITNYHSSTNFISLLLRVLPPAGSFCPPQGAWKDWKFDDKNVEKFYLIN